MIYSPIRTIAMQMMTIMNMCLETKWNLSKNQGTMALEATSPAALTVRHVAVSCLESPTAFRRYSGRSIDMFVLHE